MPTFLHDDDNADAKTIAEPEVFSENSRAKKMDSNRRIPDFKSCRLAAVLQGYV